MMVDMHVFSAKLHNDMRPISQDPGRREISIEYLPVNFNAVDAAVFPPGICYINADCHTAEFSR